MVTSFSRHPRDGRQGFARRVSAGLAGLVLAGAGAFGFAFTLPCVASAEDCASAQKAVEQAQQALSKASRDAVTSADAYGQCMSSGGAACAPKKAAFDAARAAKAKASSALKDATSKQHSVCH